MIVLAAVNINQLLVYCKLVDSPYKNKKSYLNVRHLSIVCAIWTFGFIIKLIAVSQGRTLYYYESKQNETSYNTACLVGLCDFFSQIIPFYCVVE